MLGGLGGDLLTGLVTAGAFAAFLSTSSGLAIAVSGVLAQDVLGGRLLGRHGVPRRRHGRGRRPARGRGAGPGPVRGPSGRAGLRGRRLDVLPAAGARHLVARADPGRRGRRAARRRARRRRRRRLDAVRRRAGELARRAAGPAGRLERAAGVRRDGRRLAGHPRRRARPRAAGSWSGCTPPRSSRSTAADPGTRCGTVRRPEIDRSADCAASTRRSLGTHGLPRRSARAPSVRLITSLSRGGLDVHRSTDAPEPHDQASRHDPIYDELHESADFVELRRRFRNFAFPATAAFLGLVPALRRDEQLGRRLHEQAGRRAHQRRPGLRAAAVRLDVPPRLALLPLHEPQRRPAGAGCRAPLQRPSAGVVRDELGDPRHDPVRRRRRDHRRHHLLGQPAEQERGRLLRRRPLVQRLPERPGHLRRLHERRVVPRHLRA